MENRHGLAMTGMFTLANGTAERRASQIMLKAEAKEAGGRITVGEDKAYDTADHVAHLRAINVTPHVTQNDSITATGKRRQSAIDGRTTRHEGYGIARSCRAIINASSAGASSTARCAAQTSWPSRRRYRLYAQSDRLQLDPHSQTAGGVGQRLFTTSRPPETPTQKRRAMHQSQGSSADC